jgi:large subunit ribosomal protein L10
MVGNTMVKPEKIAVVKEIKEKLEKATSVILSDFRGLTFDQLATLRSALREKGAEFRIVKNTLTRIAIKELGLIELTDFLTGPTAIAFSYEDPIVATKILADFARENKTFTIKGGLLEGKFVDQTELKMISSLPSRDILLAKLTGILKAPVYGFAGVISAPLQGLIGTLNAVAQSSERGGE